MKYEILDTSGKVVNTILADDVFCEAAYPGLWRRVESEEPDVTPDEGQRKQPMRLSRREFIIRVGLAYSAIMRLKDINNSLGPDEKNYELSRLFDLWDVSEYIDLADPDLIAAFSFFVESGVISQEAYNAIFDTDAQ